MLCTSYKPHLTDRDGSWRIVTDREPSPRQWISMTSAVKRKEKTTPANRIRELKRVRRASQLAERPRRKFFAFFVDFQRFNVKILIKFLSKSF